MGCCIAHKRRIGALLALTALSGGWQEAQALSEKDFLGDLPVVLGAARLAQPKQDAPASITVIDRAMIEASPALDIPDVLRLVPGFQVAQWSGSERSITSHGLADQLGRRMQVLVDGRSVYDPVFGGALWQSLPLSLADVERIEVIRGPDAAAWGSNAFLGTINIITRSPGGERGGRALVTVGSYGRRQADLAEDWVSGVQRLQLRAGALMDDGFVDRHDDSRSKRVNLRYQTSLSPRDELDIQLGLRDSTVQKGFPNDTAQPLRDTDLRHLYQQLTWKRALPNGADLSLQLYHSYQSNQDVFPFLSPLAPVPSFFDFSFTAHRYDAELQWRLSPAPGTRLVLGGGWRLDQSKAKYTIDPDADTSVRQLRLFAHGEQRLAERWLLQAGAMAENFEHLGSYVSPRVSLNYSFLPHQAVRVSLARGYRIPSLYEQHANYGIYAVADGSEVFIVETSPDRIKPESITAFEIGLVGDLEHLRTNYDLKLFHHDIQNLIDTVRVDPPGYPISLWEFHNSGQMDLHGMELQLDARPTPRTDLHFTWSYAEPDGSRLKSLQTPVPVYTSLDNRVPHHTLSALLRQRFGHGWSGSASWIYVNKMVWGGEGDNPGPISRVDMKVSRALQLQGSEVRLELLVQNLFDRNYYDFYVPQTYRSGNLFDRRFYAQVRVTH